MPCSARSPRASDLGRTRTRWPRRLAEKGTSPTSRCRSSLPVRSREPTTASSISFIDLAGIEDTAIEQGVPEDKAAALRADYQSSPNDSVIIQGIEGSNSSLGFVGFAYADQQGDQIEKVQIDGGDGCVEPSADTIRDGSYPLSRSLYIYVNTDKVASNPTLKSFVD